MFKIAYHARKPRYVVRDSEKFPKACGTFVLYVTKNINIKLFHSI